MAKNCRNVYIIVEKYQVNEYSDEYQGTNVKECFDNLNTAEFRKRELQDWAQEQSQDFEYDIEIRCVES